MQAIYLGNCVCSCSAALGVYLGGSKVSYGNKGHRPVYIRTLPWHKSCFSMFEPLCLHHWSLKFTYTNYIYKVRFESLTIVVAHHEAHNDDDSGETRHTGFS